MVDWKPSDGGGKVYVLHKDFCQQQQSYKAAEQGGHATGDMFQVLLNRNTQKLIWTLYFKGWVDVFAQAYTANTILS